MRIAALLLSAVAVALALPNPLSGTVQLVLHGADDPAVSAPLRQNQPESQPHLPYAPPPHSNSPPTLPPPQPPSVHPPTVQPPPILPKLPTRPLSLPKLSAGSPSTGSLSEERKRARPRRLDMGPREPDDQTDDDLSLCITLAGLAQHEARHAHQAVRLCMAADASPARVLYDRVVSWAARWTHILRAVAGR